MEEVIQPRCYRRPKDFFGGYKDVRNLVIDARSHKLYVPYYRLTRTRALWLLALTLFHSFCWVTFIRRDSLLRARYLYVSEEPASLRVFHRSLEALELLVLVQPSSLHYKIRASLMEL